MPSNIEHRDYGGSSGTGSKSNCQSQPSPGSNSDAGSQDNRLPGERIADNTDQRHNNCSDVAGGDLLRETYR